MNTIDMSGKDFAFAAINDALKNKRTDVDEVFHVRVGQVKNVFRPVMRRLKDVINRVPGEPCENFIEILNAAGFSEKIADRKYLEEMKAYFMETLNELDCLKNNPKKFYERGECVSKLLELCENVGALYETRRTHYND